MTAEQLQSQPSSYLDMARIGEGAGWRYIVGLFFVCGTYMVVGLVSYFAFVVAVALFLSNSKLLQKPPTTAAEWRNLGIDPIIDYVVLNLSFIGLLVLILLAVAILHRRSFLSLITAKSRFDWRRLSFGMLVWSTLAVLSSVSEYFVFPQDYRMGTNLHELWKYVPVVLLLTPLQCLAEEVLCRGYFMQGLSLLTRNNCILAIVSAVFFMLPHLGNPEMAENPVVVAAVYLSIGVILAAVALKTGSLEVGIGAHVGNNLLCLVLNSEDSALTVPSVFVCTHPHPEFELATLILGGFLFFFATPPERGSQVLKEPEKA